ncbi:unnamed protein product, partial [Staurois parvus]
ILHFQGAELLVNKTVLLPVHSCTLLCSCAQHSHAKQCDNSEAQKHTAHIVKQHTVNRLIAPHVNPFLPSAISTVSVLFSSTDHCIGVTRDVSDTKSVPPTVSECPRSPAISR